MKKGWLLLGLLLGCEPGKVGDVNDDAIFFEWEEGDEAPRIAEGHIYCEYDPAEFYVFYIYILLLHLLFQRITTKRMWILQPL